MQKVQLFGFTTTFLKYFLGSLRDQQSILNSLTWTSGFLPRLVMTGIIMVVKGMLSMMAEQIPDTHKIRSSAADSR